MFAGLGEATEILNIGEGGGIRVCLEGYKFAIFCSFLFLDLNYPTICLPLARQWEIFKAPPRSE